MARQPRRSSTLVLAINQRQKFKSRTYFEKKTYKYSLPLLSLSSHRQFYLFLVITISLAGNALSSHSYDSESIAVGSGSPDPKFGDRLLPRNKQIISAHLGFNFYPSTVSQSPLISVNSSNSINNSSNFLYSSSNSKKSIKQKSVDGVKDAYSVTQDKNRNNLSSKPLAAAQKNPRRQGKQLDRRNDENIDDEEIHSEIFPLPESNTNISRADRLEMSTEFFIVPSTIATTTTRSSYRSLGKVRGSLSGPAFVQQQQPNKVGHGPRHVLILAPKNGATNNSKGTPNVFSLHSQSGLRKEPWVIPVLVLASLTMIVMGAFEIFVLFKAWRTSPSRRHLFLGQMLLLGLFACAGLGAIITAHPTLITCGAIRFGVGVAYALVFAALLVKCVFLISLNGGVYLPAPYQGLLLLFAVLIQVAIGTQWLMTQPPEIYTTAVPVSNGGYMTAAAMSATTGMVTSSASSSFFNEMKFSSPSSSASEIITRGAPTMLIPLCKTQFSELLLSLIYIVFLIVFVAVLAIKSRGIRDNYREATYIGLAIGGAIPIWLGWMLCGLAVADRHKDACIAFGLVATSATVFLVMFMPKGRQLAAMGKEGLYVEDREEQFSSLSRAGSGYSPSFFHFKPIKYGVMGAMPNSTSNTANGNSMKHCSNALNGGGK